MCRQVEQRMGHTCSSHQKCTHRDDYTAVLRLLKEKPLQQSHRTVAEDDDPYGGSDGFEGFLLDGVDPLSPRAGLPQHLNDAAAAVHHYHNYTCQPREGEIVQHDQLELGEGVLFQST